MATGAPGDAILDASGLPALFAALHERGYTVVGPTLRDGAIVVAELESADDLPYGWGVDTGPGRYRLRRRDDPAAFGHSGGPQSYKAVVHPPRARLWSADRVTGRILPGGPDPPRYALLGVRACDLRALGVLDRVLAGGAHADPVYRARRDGSLVIAVECTEPGGACFCASMGSGPAVDHGYDLAMVERVDADGHRFVVRAGSPAGAELLDTLPVRPATGAEVVEARRAVAAAPMGRAMWSGDLRALLAGSRESPHWDDVASRCLTCGNCTMVCPTCFCTTTEDTTDLAGGQAHRWRRWDSCYSLDFSYLHGGSVRRSGQSRYRQWISHKLGTWHDQFDSSGCVGCGRCVVWCPVGIDITREVDALVAVNTSVAARVDAHPFLSGLTDAQRAALAADATAVRLPAGRRVFREGGPADRFWLIESGRVALDVPVPGREDTVIETLTGPTVLGWSWLVPPYRWHFGAIAREDTGAIAFDAVSVRRRCAADPELGRAILTRFIPVVADRLHATRLRLLDLYGRPR